MTAGAPALGTDQIPIARSGASDSLLLSDVKSYVGGTYQAGQTILTSGDLSTASTSFVNATGVASTITTGAHRCLVTFSGGMELAAAAYACIDLAIDGTRQGQTFGLTFVRAVGGAMGGNASFTYLTSALTAASHTFQIMWRVTASTGTMYASTTAPAIISVVELGI